MACGAPSALCPHNERELDGPGPHLAGEELSTPTREDLSEWPSVAMRDLAFPASFFGWGLIKGRLFQSERGTQPVGVLGAYGGWLVFVGWIRRAVVFPRQHIG